jgi:putative DNA primase/helicase
MPNEEWFARVGVPTWSTAPPASETEARASAPRQTPFGPEQTRHQLTDLGNAEAFVELHSRRFRHVRQRREWLFWKDGRWHADATGEVERAAKQVARALFHQAAEMPDFEAQKKSASWALRSQSDARIRALLTLAATELPIVVSAAELDCDPYLLACENGTLDLRTGNLRQHDPFDLISLGTDLAYDPKATCPRWQQFLTEVFDGDTELVNFVQRAVGYSLTGDTRERVLFVLHGAGFNGKTTAVETVKRIAGDLASTSPFETFVRVRGGHGPRNDLARLYRKRLVVAAESAEGRRLDEATIKLVTGGDTIAARFLYGEYFEFRPSFKIWLVTNHRPRVDGDDDAIWDRLRLIPFGVNFKGRDDPTLAATLAKELPGILAWAVAGCLTWQRDGLGLPPAVEQATAEYRQDEDVLGAFLAERCLMDGTIEAADLRSAYEDYCREIGERPLAASALGRRLSQRGIQTDKEGGKRMYRGVRLDGP